MDGLTENQKEIIKAVEEMLPSIRKLPDPMRSQSLLCMAYEYFIADMEERAYPLLEEADPNYFSEQLGKDMADDSRMLEIVMRIMDKLVDIGIVKVTAKE
jgi:hypothetical protein